MSCTFGFVKTTMLCKRNLCSVVVLASALFLGGCKQPAPPQLSLIGSEVSLKSFTEAMVISKFRITNPNPLPLVGKASYSLQLDDKHLVDGIIPRVELAAADESELLIQTAVPLVSAFKSLGNLISNISSGQKEVEYLLTGDLEFVVAAGLINIPLMVPLKAVGEISLPELPQVSLKEIEVRKIDFTGIDLRIKTKVINPNAFSVFLEGLNYSLTAGGKKFFSGNFAPASELEQGQKDLPWDLRISFADVDGDILDILRNNIEDISLETENLSLK